MSNKFIVEGGLSIPSDKVLTMGSTDISVTEIGYLDGITAGTAAASKAIIVDASGNVNASALTFTDLGTVTTVDINGGSINGATIAESDVNVTGQTLSLDDDQISGDKISGGTIDSVTITGSVLDDGITATTQSSGDNSTKVATTAYVDTQVSSNNSWTVSDGTSTDEIDSAETLEFASGDAASSFAVTEGTVTLSIGTDGSSLEVDSSNGLQVKALGVTNAMLAGSIDSTKIAELTNFDTDDLAEGSNLYYTTARWDTKMAAADTGDLAEGSNLYYLDSRARASVSVTDNGGDGALSYDSGTGVISYTGPSAAEVRTHFAAGDGLAVADGSFSVNVDDSGIEIDSDSLQLKNSGVTLAKHADLGDMKVIGNVSGSSATPAEVSILDEDDMNSDSATALVTQQSIKKYVDDQIGGDANVGGENATGTFSTLTTDSLVANEADIALLEVGEVHSDADENLIFKADKDFRFYMDADDDGDHSFTWFNGASATVADLDEDGNLDVEGSVTGTSFVSEVATGTAPLTVASTTKVANLNADLLDGMSTIDEDDMSSDSATSLPTQQSVKAYVDSQVGAANQLNFTADSNAGGNDTEIDLTSETLSIIGTSDEIETSVSADNTVKIGLPDDVTIGDALNVTGTGTFTAESVHNGGIDCNGTLAMEGNNITGTAANMLLQAGSDTSEDFVNYSSGTLALQADDLVVVVDDCQIGDDSGDKLTITAEINSNVHPDSDSAYDLGSSDARWADVYADSHLTEFSKKSAFSVDMTGSAVEVIDFSGYESCKAVVKVKDSSGNVTSKEILAVDGQVVEYATVNSGTEVDMTIACSGTSVTIDSANGTAKGSFELIA